MMRKGLQRLLLLGVLGGMFAWAQADGSFKFGYVNTERVFSESNAAKSMQKKLEQEFAPQRARLQDIEKQGMQLQKQMSKSSLSAQQRMALEKEFLELDRKYRAATDEFNQSYILRRNEEFAAIQARAYRILNELARKENYDLILQDAVYVKPQYDLTDRVIKLLNQ